MCRLFSFRARLMQGSVPGVWCLASARFGGCAGTNVFMARSDPRGLVNWALFAIGAQGGHRQMSCHVAFFACGNGSQEPAVVVAKRGPVCVPGCARCVRPVFQVHAMTSSTQDIFRIATRESRLALWQAGHVASLLRAQYPQARVELVGMTTRGDQILDKPLSEIGGKGLFTKELEVALLDGRADLAVHSLKDVPMDLPDGFALAAMLSRADPRDAFVSNRFESLDALPADAVVGTSSLRRAAQLQARHPGFRIRPLRGNLDTRLGKLDAGQYDAIVLAAAGLTRLGLASRIRDYLPTSCMVPAPGQGMLGIEIRADRADMQQALAFLNDPSAACIAAAERAVSRQLGGNCKTPLAAFAFFVAPGLMRIEALLAGDDGTLHRCTREEPVADAEAARVLGEQVAAVLAASAGRVVG